MSALRYGYTTGSCATAAAKAALLSLVTGRPVTEISIQLPANRTVRFYVPYCKIDGISARCAVKKDGGDDPDCTSGLLMYADVSFCHNEGIVIKGGEGVGTVTKPGLQVAVGEWAINPVPRHMIQYELTQLLDFYKDTRGVKVILSVPGGERVAEKTFNPRLGIVGGISIIGTTGIVRPYATEAIKKSLLLFLNQAQEKNCVPVVLVPGNIGEKAARRRYVLMKEQVVPMSNYVGFMVRHATQRFKTIVVLGHPGKLMKIVYGYFNTHSHRSPSLLSHLQNDILRCQWPDRIMSALNEATTVEGVIQSLSPQFQTLFFDFYAEKIEDTLCRHTTIPASVGVVLVDMKGRCIGRGKTACMVEEQGWLRLR